MRKVLRVYVVRISWSVVQSSPKIDIYTPVLFIVSEKVNGRRSGEKAVTALYIAFFFRPSVTREKAGNLRVEMNYGEFILFVPFLL